MASSARTLKVNAPSLFTCQTQPGLAEHEAIGNFLIGRCPFYFTCAVIFAPGLHGTPRFDQIAAQQSQHLSFSLNLLVNCFSPQLIQGILNQNEKRPAMHIYESKFADIDLPHVDLLTLLFGEL